MGKTFNVWKFQVLYTSCNIKEMSLKEFFERYTGPVLSTKEFFFHKKHAFICNEYTTEGLTAEIEKGLALFPIAKNQHMDAVKRYIDMGLSPVFMRSADFREFRKIYGK